MNKIITIKIHVDFAYLKLFAQRKAQVTKKCNYGWHKSFMAMGEKKGGPSSSIITPYFEFTNLTKKIIEAQQMFVEGLVFYICKGLWAFFHY